MSQAIFPILVLIIPIISNMMVFVYRKKGYIESSATTQEFSYHNYMAIGWYHTYAMAVNGQNRDVIGTWSGSSDSYNATGMLENLVYELEMEPGHYSVKFEEYATTVEMENHLANHSIEEYGGAVSFDQVDPERLILKMRIHTDSNYHTKGHEFKQILYSMTDCFMMYVRKIPLRVVSASSKVHM